MIDVNAVTECELTACAIPGARANREARDAKLARDIAETIAAVQRDSADLIARIEAELAADAARVASEREGKLIAWLFTASI